MPAPATPAIPRALTLTFGFILLFTGCVSGRYKKARPDTPPPEPLNVNLARGPLETGLNTLIVYNGPGSWKRNACWDEYVISLRNPGDRPLTVSSLSLVGFAGIRRSPGLNPWALEKESQTLEQKYRDLGVAFVRYTAPGVLIIAAGSGAVAASGVITATAATVASATVIALPIYYISVLAINHHNKAAIEKEFNQRRLGLPLTLAPGEARTGSLFFPMVPSPRSLNLQWADGPATGEAVLPLDFLAGLHLQAPAASAPRVTPPKDG